ncbi:MAG: hypothetical protein WC270_04670 [Patescibacteria group bacterium]|jgi:hypothetical protein
MKQRLLLSKPSVILAMLAMVFAFSIPAKTTKAAALTGLKDTASRLEQGIQGTHSFAFTTTDELSATETIKILFDSPADSFTLDGTIVATDFSALTGIAVVDNIAACSGTASEVYPTVITANDDESYTLTVCTGDTVAGGAIAFTIDNNEITNPAAAGVYVIDVSTTATTPDSGSLALAIIADDTVSVTATVDPSVTFSISDVAIGFGVLDATNDCWALGVPPAACDTVYPPTAAHTFSLGTNATDGVALTYSGATLTNLAADTITVATVAGDTSDPVGTPNTEQFAIGFDDNAATYTFADTAAYDQSLGNYKFVAGATTPILSIAGPVAATSIDAHYLANISAATESGAYSTSITYIATGTF